MFSSWLGVVLGFAILVGLAVGICCCCVLCSTRRQGRFRRAAALLAATNETQLKTIWKEKPVLWDVCVHVGACSADGRVLEWNEVQPLAVQMPGEPTSTGTSLKELPALAGQEIQLVVLVDMPAQSSTMISSHSSIGVSKAQVHR
ncbi:hypothetical protein MKEN_00402000 [Mycena kentingensis (nom. inval.)]|nr:hypothetical protein MKEN_00402000 [Mycena kentingensis (nom. inval.)]